MKQLALEYSVLLDKIEETDKFVINECKAFVKDAKVKFKQDQEDEKTISRDESVPLIAKYQVNIGTFHLFIYIYNSSKALMIPGLKEEIEYNEHLIDEREAEIQNISRASNLINELFQQIGILTAEQQDLVGKGHNKY